MPPQPVVGAECLREDLHVDAAQLRTAFDEVFDQAVLFHGFTNYMRDYEVFVHVTADPRTGILPEHVRLLFKNCVKALVTTTIPAQVWAASLDDRLLDYELGKDLDGYVWGVNWHLLYPGIRLLDSSPAAERWSAELQMPFYEATIETNAHKVALVFSDLAIDTVLPGHAPFVVGDGGPDFKIWLDP